MPKFPTLAEKYEFLTKLYEETDFESHIRVPILPLPGTRGGDDSHPPDEIVQARQMPSTEDTSVNSDVTIPEDREPITGPSTVATPTDGMVANKPTDRTSTALQTPFQGEPAPRPMSKKNEAGLERFRLRLAAQQGRPNGTLAELIKNFDFVKPSQSLASPVAPAADKKHLTCVQCECFTHSLRRVVVRFSSQTALKRHERTQHTKWDQLELAMMTDNPTVFCCPSGDYTANTVEDVQMHCVRDSCVDREKYCAMKAKKDELCKSKAMQPFPWLI